jgi:transposase
MVMPVEPSPSANAFVAFPTIRFPRIVTFVLDAMWARIESLLPSSDGKWGGRWADHRTVVEGIAWRFRAGTPWRDVPDDFGPWKTLWKHHDRWSSDGTWDRLLAEMCADADAAAELDWLVAGPGG